MFSLDIVAGIEVSIELVPTGATVKQGLRTTIVARLIATPATGLARVTWVNALNTDTALLCLVEGEAVQLSKRPTMHAALPFTLAMGDTFSDSRQILKDKGAPRRSRLYNALSQEQQGRVAKEAYIRRVRVMVEQSVRSHLLYLTRDKSEFDSYAEMRSSDLSQTIGEVLETLMRRDLQGE